MYKEYMGLLVCQRPRTQMQSEEMIKKQTWPRRKSAALAGVEQVQNKTTGYSVKRLKMSNPGMSRARCWVSCCNRKFICACIVFVVG